MTPSSKELLEMANLEWKNREERKGIHDKVSWTSGWISGYLTLNPQVGRGNDLEGLNELTVWEAMRDCKDYRDFKRRMAELRQKDGE